MAVKKTPEKAKAPSKKPSAGQSSSGGKKSPGTIELAKQLAAAVIREHGLPDEVIGKLREAGVPEDVIERLTGNIYAPWDAPWESHKSK